MVTKKLFKGKTFIKFLEFIYNNYYFFRSGSSCDHSGFNVKLPLIFHASRESGTNSDNFILQYNKTYKCQMLYLISFCNYMD